MAFRELVFSGVQPTGNLHLGNYLGAIKRFVELQNRYDCIYCIVDLHAITTWQDPVDLPKAIREVTAAFIASGIDPKKHIVFNQSQVAEHTELAWVFNCVARMGWLNRMTQFKEKAGKDRENASVGLYAYPTLMAADILVYRATHVPVGEDQKQHLELARDIAQKFNNDFGLSISEHGYGDSFFPLPEPLITGEATRVMSLREGVQKMSKSDASDQSRINLTDDADIIAMKIRRAKTDSAPLPSDENGLSLRPEAANLVAIFAALSGDKKSDVLREYGNAQFSTFKSALTELTVSKLGPITAEMKRLLRDPIAIDEVLADGAARAQVLAGKTMTAVKEIVGLIGRRNVWIGYSSLASTHRRAHWELPTGDTKSFVKRQTEAAITHLNNGEWDTALTLAAMANATLSPTSNADLARQILSHSEHQFVYSLERGLDNDFEDTLTSLIRSWKKYRGSDVSNSLVIADISDSLIRSNEEFANRLVLQLRNSLEHHHGDAFKSTIFYTLETAWLIEQTIARFSATYQESPGMFQDFLKRAREARPYSQ